jgi:hypothetical protein
VSIGEVAIGVDRLWLLGIAVVLTVGLWAMSRYTVFGLATSAVAESERSASALGWSPDFVAGSNWALGGSSPGWPARSSCPSPASRSGATTARDPRTRGVSPRRLLVVPAHVAGGRGTRHRGVGGGAT